MRFTIAASALFAGLAVAMPAVTVTQQSTEVDTITSCGPEVTNCPARSTSAPVVEATSTPAASVPAVATSAVSSAPPAAVTSAPVVAGNSTTGVQSTIYLLSTTQVVISSCAPEVTNCPLRTSVSSFVTGSTVVPVASVPAESAPASSPVAPVASAPFPVSNGTASWYAPSGTAAGTGAASASATYPAAYTGAASSLNAGMALAGVGAFAALLL